MIAGSYVACGDNKVGDGLGLDFPLGVLLWPYVTRGVLL